MPQVDLESLVCGAAGAGAGDRKVSCETVIAGGGCACRGIGGPGRKMASDDDDYGEEDEEPSIAGMRKFKSGRRAATWGQEALAAAAAAASPGEAQEGEEKHESHETEHWARLPVS